MATILTNHGAHHLRLYSSVNINANGALIVDDGTGSGKPLRSKNGGLAVGDNSNRLLTPTGQPVRIQQSTVLVNQDAGAHKTANSPAVLRLMAARIEEIEAWEAAADDSGERRPDGEMLVRDFFLNVFLPYVKTHKAPSTYESHKGFWDAYLRDHFNHTKTLKGYEPFMGTNFLEQLATKYSANTVKNIRAVASAAFGYAAGKGYITVNPWQDVLTRIKCVEVEETKAYDQKGIERILAALATVQGREAYSARMAEMIISVCFYGGLRPSEAAGLRWENVNFDESSMHICEVFVSGQFKKTTKTDENREVPLLPTIQKRLRLWHAERLHPREGLVFPNQKGDKPININDLSSRIIGPTLEKHGLDWWTLYACRRGFGTLLVNAGASLEEASLAMGNNPQTMFRFYFKKQNSKLAVSGMRKLANALEASETSDSRLLKAGS